MSSRTLTKTNVEAFNVRPRRRSHGPCTCSLDMSISGSIRNIFEQVDVEQRKMGERAYLKYIVNKILDGNVEVITNSCIRVQEAKGLLLDVIYDAVIVG